MADADVDRPDRATLTAQYDRALLEYRFQVDLNWRRSEYLFVLNIGVFVAAVGLLAASGAPRVLVLAVFLLGAVMAALSVLANRTQHGYYAQARDLKTALEDQLGLEEHRLATTPGMGSRVARLGRVKTFLLCMLAALFVADLGGALVSAGQALDRATPRVLVSVELREPASRPVRIVVARRTGVARVATVPRGSRQALFRVPAGAYRVTVLGAVVCTARIRVRERAFERAAVACSG